MLAVFVVVVAVVKILVVLLGGQTVYRSEKSVEKCCPSQALLGKKHGLHTASQRTKISRTESEPNVCGSFVWWKSAIFNGRTFCLLLRKRSPAEFHPKKGISSRSAHTETHTHTAAGCFACFCSCAAWFHFIPIVITLTKISTQFRRRRMCVCLFIIFISFTKPRRVWIVYI